MTDEEIKTSYIEWMEMKTNNKFDIDNLPGGIKLALEQLIKTDPLSFSVTSEKLSDMSQTFANDGGVPKIIMDYLKPYRVLRFI